MRKIGFCCKWIDTPEQTNGIKPTDDAKKYNTGVTTVRWLNENQHKAHDKLEQLVISNLEATYRLVERVGNLDESLRMVRISSDILPLFTEPRWHSYYRDGDVLSLCERSFAKIGELARARSVRLSFHPGQYCVLSSSRNEVVDASVNEFEYHTTMAKWMGYGSKWHEHGFKINVHIAGANGADGILAILPKLSQEAQNLITIENEEMKWGLDETLKLEKHLPIVLDIHHHWVKTGEYIRANDDRVKRIIDSWRGVRPTLHYSMPKSEFVAPHLDNEGLPDYQAAIAAGVKRASLRAHSDFYWCQAANDWAATFLPEFDIQAEAKAKNLASFALAKSVGL